ncbi:hypothetical protein NEOLEDRAFT_1244205 [Neolentinus lepideus HHB14362 ss-1]|uniref:F-box domain-containing protein n=1 Tax=Neolentinus lepideus HHB14362 ss-1 TaxID=1314782 RepID=A0A165Q868_9AGAM|nr:hypothetical protein NEOLEDRAFT_1244205 [Neolentinus lepideus HHB14362 ss-1]
MSDSPALVDSYVQRTPSLTASDETDSDRMSLRTESRERSLPRLPAEDQKPPRHRPPPVDHRRSNRLSHFLLASPFFVILQQPRLLARLLGQIEWSDFNALTCTCRRLRWSVFSRPELKAVILSHYVPGYRYCLRNSDMDRYRDIRITLRDLNYFMVSQGVPLHQYPMHALSLLSAFMPTFEQEEVTQKYMAATLAHSRFVLILQSLIHSAVLPPTPDSEGSRLSLGVLQAGVRELVFPAPLSYFGGKDALQTRSASRGGRSSSRSSGRTSRSVGSLLSLTKAVKARSQPVSEGKNRLSLFGGNPRAPLPPPAEEPAAMRFYSGGWRRAFRTAGYASEDDFEPALNRPHRRFASDGVSSSDSSLSSPSPVRSSSTSEPSSIIQASRSPHDIQLATSRSRAPILRVFVPCAELSEASMRACEDQLADAGLWDHLSTGDIVCNLGYVPEQDHDQADWLIFNGYSLVLFQPPAPPPLHNPLTLPSPLYYAHILPLSMNPTYTLALPAPAYPPQMTLVYMTTSVPSVRSPTGRMPVKKYMWLAVLRAQLRPGLGEGWQAQWVLEGEGTKEGKQTLLDAISGKEGIERDWEVVREKCHGGRIWLKLLTPGEPHTRMAETLVHSPRTQSR